ncbi:Cellulose synthase-like protein E1 [Hibiscus syriacus]|uniref:Cellulose synthase-like protein E1 n=1 Tax=Hibiscus syriacus TaxID=106335 RepID=A0A6A2YWZ8_HIBSY|nr:cellulose synthase-like protein E1 [Hibiscus syriacus]KAE8684051.1 Cellulose synthase-like protein E1 [Hibiscus syriacus]
MGSRVHLPLFETRLANGLLFFRFYAASIFITIFFICFYRLTCFPLQQGKIQSLSWFGMFLSELWFGFYFFTTVVVRWNPVFRSTFKSRLSSRYAEEALPGVDIFVCTADPVIEPPIMVINTVLSVMAYDYPSEKLSVYLSDDGCSDLMFYALLEAARFSRVWLPFCRKLKVEPRSPEIYFRNTVEPSDDSAVSQRWLLIKKSYEEMKMRIETMAKLDKIPGDIRKEHKGFREWHFVSTRHDHQSILQIIIDGRDPSSMDIEGKPLPTLVYLAREKRPHYHHNFKAGALNALIRVSSRISNAPFILNVDCDMFSNNSEAIRDALCFFLDEEKGREIAYVQYPQSFDNLTENDIYGNCSRVRTGLEFAGFDGNGGPLYNGTGCFHRRQTLCGMKYREDFKFEWKPMEYGRNTKQSANVLEQSSKALASCSFEENTQWGKEMGLKYGSIVENILTGLSIQCRGWRSIYFNPERKAFLGVAPKTLLQYLIQQKRWAEGDFQLFLSKYCPLIYGHKRIPLKLQLSYCLYFLWAVNCLATLYYVTVPSLCLVKGIPLFPKMSCLWVLSFAYAMIASCMQSLGEFLCCGGTIQGWLNDQRTWMFKRTTSYLFAFSDTIMSMFGFSESTFVITEKVADEEISQRYEQEVMEFGTPSVMFTVLTTLAQLNLFSCTLGIRKVVTDDVPIKILDQFGLQMILSSVLVLLNLPIYQGLFFRKDTGKMPSSVTYKSNVYALLACTIAMY